MKIYLFFILSSFLLMGCSHQDPGWKKHQMKFDENMSLHIELPDYLNKLSNLSTKLNEQGQWVFSDTLNLRSLHITYKKSNVEFDAYTYIINAAKRLNKGNTTLTYFDMYKADWVDDTPFALYGKLEVQGSDSLYWLEGATFFNGYLLQLRVEDKIWKRGRDAFFNRYNSALRSSRFVKK